MVVPVVADLATMAPEIAIIGCGNPNRCDDGVGSQVLRRLAGTLREYGQRVRLLDAGTDGMGVMFAARSCRALIIVDACRSGAQAGAIFEVPGACLARPPRDNFTLHDFRWDHALYAGRRIFAEDFPSEVTVFLVEAERVDFGIELSSAVACSAERVAVMIADRVRMSCTAEEFVP